MHVKLTPIKKRGELWCLTKVRDTFSKSKCVTYCVTLSNAKSSECCKPYKNRLSYQF